MPALVLQVISISIVIAGVWLSDFSLPTKMIISGTGASLFVFVQYQLITILEQLAVSQEQLKTWVRVIESSVELTRTDPRNRTSARDIVMHEVQDENKALKLKETITPSWYVDFLAFFFGVAMSLPLAFLWVFLFRKYA